MIEQMKNVMIAIFTIAALAIIVYIITYLNPTVGNEANLLHVRFADIDKINKGTRVNFSGKPVGEVLDIVEIRSPNGERVINDGIVYPYALTLAINSDVIVFTSDEFSARTSGLLGERYVEITPLPKGQHTKRATSDSMLYATEVGTVESTLKAVKKLSEKLDIALDNVNDIFDTLKKKNTWENIAKTIENLHTMSNTMVQGKGTIGQLVMKDNTYLQLSSMLSKGETILDDINHYGVLFHLDKGWQRLRARRLNLLQQLSTPQEFRNYFNDEIDNITTSLARVSMIMHQTGDQNQLWQNSDYKKVYAELLRRVSRLEEYLEMFNQQVVNNEIKKTELSQNPEGRKYGKHPLCAD